MPVGDRWSQKQLHNPKDDLSVTTSACTSRPSLYFPSILLQPGMASCPFYSKRCNFLAPCCGQKVCCFRCHDQVEDHVLPRQLLQHVICNRCQHSQPLAEGSTCLTCGTHFAEYFCQDCGTANDDVPAAGYFHCDACGICRVGSRQEFFHCNGCGCCLRRALQGNHVCHDRVLDTTCPICQDHRPLFSSQDAADMLPCGHFAHRSCIDSTSTPLHAVCRACSGASSSNSRSYRAARPTAPTTGGAASSSSSSSSQYRAGVQESAGAVGGSAAGRNGYVQDMMGMLEGSFQLGDTAEVESMLRELYEVDGLLPRREVKFLSEAVASTRACLHSHPKQFRQCLEAALYKSVLLTQAEVAAKGRAIDAVVQLLLQASSGGSLQLAGQRVTIDRFAVAGSVGKGVSVQDDFDIDLVALINVPTVPGINDSWINGIDLADPDATQNSEWMMQLQQQVIECLGQPGVLDQPEGLHLIGTVRQGRTAVTFMLSVHVPESGREVELEVDVVLAPNFAAGAGAAVAASLGVRGGEPADIQLRAVLAPVLALADMALGISRASSSSTGPVRGPVRPSYARNIWLTEAATEFVRQAAVAAGDTGRLSGRVVTSTIRLLKAWVRRGLQTQEPGFKKLKSFMIELIVLRAAQTFGSRQRAIGVSSQGYGGRYVLDLLLETLAVMIEWANAAEPTTAGATATAFPAPQQLILFTELVDEKYYSGQQAQALVDLGWQDTVTGLPGWSRLDIRRQFSVMPAVVHPVDPVSNVFAQEEGRRFELWGVLRDEALQLLGQLKQCTWEEIMQGSSLGRALSSTP